MNQQAMFYNSELPEHVPASLVHDFNIFDPGEGEVDHFTGFRRLFELGVPDIFWTRHNGGHWVVARGEYIPEIAANPVTFSSTRMTVPDQHNLESRVLLPIMADPPAHTGYRALINPIFSPRSINQMKPAIRAYTVSLIEGFRYKGECDFVADFGMQMPIGVFMRLADIPEAHRLPLLALVDRMIHPSAESKEDVLALFLDYVRPIIAERRANPGDDIFSTLIHAKVNGELMTQQELEGFCTLLLLGGLDTVANTLSLITHFLAQSDSHRDQLIANLGNLTNSVDELLRRFPTVTGPGRYVIRDTCFHDVEMKHGDHILTPRPMYNFDHRLFDDPMKVDFNRPKPIHASFGTPGGPHRCPGSYLARSEITIFLEEWLTRIPDFRVKPEANVVYKGGQNVSIVSLPLSWTSS